MEESVSTGSRGGRPMVLGRRGAVSSGHYLASEIGIAVLRRGGNAADAAAAMGFALALLVPHQNGIAGEAPILVRTADDGQVHAVNGHGTAPAAATVEFFRGLGIEQIPADGFLPAIVPPAVDTWITLLGRFGTMRLADVLGPAVELARDGFAMYDSLAGAIEKHAERFRAEWPTSAAVFVPGGRVPQPGELFRNPDWADTLEPLIAAEAGRDRRDGLAAASDVFYRGPIAERICRFARNTSVRDANGVSSSALLTTDDFAGYRAAVEPAASATYHGWRVFKCGPWTQGPAMLATLNLLEGFNLTEMGHNSADYVHTVVEAMKLAYADREFYYGDPAAADVDLERLLSKPYADGRRGLVDPRAASLELRPGGLGAMRAESVLDVERAMAAGSGSARAAAGQGDTTKLEAIDAAGNVVSATVSGGWLWSSPVIEGMGFPLGTRGQMFSLTPGHPNCVAPGKRPRSTLTPGIAVRADGGAGAAAGARRRLAAGHGETLAFGSPGGDCQDQWAVQFFLNVVHFGMNLQQAVEAATFWTDHWPDSFYPRRARPGSLRVEGRIDPAVREALAGRGHLVEVMGDWSGGNTLAARHDPKSGLCSAAASPRLDPAYAIAF